VTVTPPLHSGRIRHLLIETAHKLAPWLAPDQLNKMDRREILKLLSTSTDIPLGGIDLLWNGTFSRISNTALTRSLLK
jgi:hypothetical protein